MIVKFDHISFVESRKEKDKILRDKGVPLFVEQSLKNLSIKNELMQVVQSNHDLYFYGDDYPTEYIFYDEVERHGNIKLEEEVLYGHYSNKKLALEFLKGIFGSKVAEDVEAIRCNMKGILDKRDYMLILEKSDNSTEAYIDNGGYGVAALISNTLFSKKPADGICTPTEVLNVNGKNLEICFTKSDSTDIIFEIIRIKE